MSNTLDFPDNPITGQQHTSSGVIWKFNGIGWIRQKTVLINDPDLSLLNDTTTLFTTESEFIEIDAINPKKGDVVVVQETRKSYKNINGTHISFEGDELSDHWQELYAPDVASLEKSLVEFDNAGVIELAIDYSQNISYNDYVNATGVDIKFKVDQTTTPVVGKKSLITLDTDENGMKSGSLWITGSVPTFSNEYVNVPMFEPNSRYYLEFIYKGTDQIWVHVIGFMYLGAEVTHYKK